MAADHKIEFKQMIVAPIYNKLQREHFKGSVLLKQVNYYIDIPDFKLEEHRSVLRIRVKGNQYEITLKTPAKVGLLEYNYTVDIRPEMNLIISNDNLPNNIRQIIVRQFGVKDTTLLMLGALTTYRQEAKYEGSLLALNKSEHSDTTGYELEFEVKGYNRGLRKFQSLLNKLNLEHRQPLSKVQCLFKKKEALSNNIN